MGATLLALAGLAACNKVTDAEYGFTAFGTDVSIEIPGSAPDQAAAAARDIERLFRVAERDWYAFGDGELARVNGQLAQGQPAPVSADLAPLITRALDLHARSGGLFDPGVCALVRLWQFDSEAALAAATGPPPATAIQALRRSQGTLAEAHFDGRTISVARPLCIDLGGMAKGTALERARLVLRQRGIGNALLNIGGSSQLALGSKAARPWYIGLRDPQANRVFGRLALAPGEAASTSGNYERGYTKDHRRYHHILDPRTGAPSTGTASVTVLAWDAELADAASTALMVAGPTRFHAVCAALGIRAALLVTTTGTLVTTPGMAIRLRRDNNGRLPLPVL